MGSGSFRAKLNSMRLLIRVRLIAPPPINLNKVQPRHPNQMIKLPQIILSPLLITPSCSLISFISINLTFQAGNHPHISDLITILFERSLVETYDLVDV